jgi:hypothetical protein
MPAFLIYGAAALCLILLGILILVVRSENTPGENNHEQPKRVVVKKNGFLFHLAYGLHSAPPKRTSRCELFWQTVFMLFIGWPIVLIIVGIVIVVAVSWGLLFASRPSWRKVEKASDSAFVPIEKWPKIAGHPVWPFTVAVIICAGYGIRLFLLHLPGYLMRLKLWFNSVGPVGSFNYRGLITIALIWFLGIFLFRFSKWLRKSELYQLFKGALSDFHRGLCPIVEFVDDKKPEESPAETQGQIAEP